MYHLILLLCLGTGAWLLRRGIQQSNRIRIAAGASLIVMTLGLFGLMDLWAEMLWFDALNYGQRFWLFVGARLSAMIAGALVAGLLVLGFTWKFQHRDLRYLTVALAATGGMVWGLMSWADALVFLNRVSAGLSDPEFGLDVGFYLFALPFLDRLYQLGLLASLLGIGAGLMELLLRNQLSGVDYRSNGGSDRNYLFLLTSSAALALLLALRHLLDRYHLMLSDLGVVKGAGWTDVQILLPGYNILAALLLVLTVLTFIPAIRAAVSKRVERFTHIQVPILNTVIAFWLTMVPFWAVALILLPMLSQSLLVIPNEITYEKPYIKRNIDFTLRGFHLNKIEKRQFPASETFTANIAQNNRELLSEVRLWDWRALDAVYEQFQEIRLYYEFPDVDIDRYHFDGRYRQVMVSARELEQENLAAQSQTFVNKRFKYTHGYGLTLATVSDFTEEGLPNMLVRDIPPKHAYAELEVDKPQIYYGELTQGPVVVNSDEAEFDYPSGEQNKYVHYDGEGGVLLQNAWRKFLFGWKFDGTRFLLSSYPNKDSRVMFHRQVRERVRKIAPFLEFDEDPYIVLVDGKLHWIIDAYTTSTYFPYSETFSSREFIQTNGNQNRQLMQQTAVDLNGVNYVRNSVKAVVDAYNGSVDFYVFEPEDPIIRVWQQILPQVFTDASKMPHKLKQHVRYPQDFLLVQGLVYAKYHMQDAEVFYNQEDLWVRATEKHYNRVQAVEPYYVMWELPGSDDAEFVLIQPFTPKNRQVLIGWIAGLSDGDNYGRFLAYQFPKEKRVLGPQQVETKIDQDPYLSGKLTLWDQRGSNVIRGNVLAIPIDDTIIYVEPIYLRADTAAYPELRLVVVMHGDNMSYAENFDEALQGLFTEQRPAIEEPSTTINRSNLGRELNLAFDAYLEALGKKQFDTASTQLKRLSKLIRQAGEVNPDESDE